jgi:diphthamide biosynthesis protein 7
VGSLSLFDVSNLGETSVPSISQLWTKQVHEDPSVPALFLAWAPENWFQNSADGFAVTFSDSRTSVFGTHGSISEEIAEWGTYEAKQMIEVWFVALSTSANPDTGIQTPFMFTGNDFGSLHTRRFDTAVLDEDEHVAPMLLEHDDRARHHTAGVTAILPLEVPMVDDAPVLLTGSYDESLRVYHATRRGEVLAEEGLDGGVWRLQLLDTSKVPGSSDAVDGAEWRFLVLASCMHAGTRLVRVTCKMQDGGSEWGIEVLAKFTEHESMNYASGVWVGGKKREEAGCSSQLLCVSSSFYDRRLCVWTVDL